MNDKILDAIREVHEQFKGGSGSGNFGHAGRPGAVGGSSGGGGGMGGSSSGGVNPEYTAMQDVIGSLELRSMNKRTGRYTTSKNLADIVDAANAAGYNLISSKTEPVIDGSKINVTRTKLGFGDYTQRGISVTTYESGKSDISFGRL